MNGLLDEPPAIGPASSGAGRWLTTLLQSMPGYSPPSPPISVPGNKYYPPYQWGGVGFPTLQRLGVLGQGAMPPGMGAQIAATRGLLAQPPAQPPAAPPPAPAMSPSQQQALAYLARIQLRGLDAMNANYGALHSTAYPKELT